MCFLFWSGAAASSTKAGAHVNVRGPRLTGERVAGCCCGGDGETMGGRAVNSHTRCEWSSRPRDLNRSYTVHASLKPSSARV